MKKFAILCGIALTVGMTACDDMLPNPPAQINPDVDQVFTDADLKVSQEAYGVNDPINLSEYFEAGEKVPVLKITELANFPTTYELAIPMEVSATDAFDKVLKLDTEIKDDMVTVSPNALNSAIRELVTKSPEMQVLYARFPAYATAASGNINMVLGGKDYYYATGEYKLLPIQNYVVEEAYYIVGNFCDWDVTKGIKLNQANPALGLYDAPVFSANFEVTADMLPFEWKVVPQSAVTAGNWDGAWAPVPAGEKALNGSLVPSAEPEAKAAVINTPGKYVAQINAEELTYQVVFAYDFLYVPGTATSLGFRSALRLTTADYMHYSGVARLKDQWWLTSEESLKKGLIFYLNPEIPVKEGFSKEGVYTYSGALTTDGAAGKALTIGTDADGKKIDGLFYITAETVALTFNATWLRTFGIVGPFCDWKAENSIPMTADKKFTTWTAKDVTLPAGPFKICTNGTFDVNFGGSVDNLVEHADDIVLPEAGTYDITLDFTKIPYTAKLVKK